MWINVTNGLLVEDNYIHTMELSARRHTQMGFKLQTRRSRLT